MLKTILSDGGGSENKAKVTDEGALQVVPHSHPVVDEPIITRPFRQYFTDNGHDDGSNDMRVDGSTNNVEFYITALTDYDLYINSASIVIADAGQTLSEFGNLNSALTNGVTLDWVTTDVGQTQIHEGLKTNFDFIRLAGGQPAFGSAADSFRAPNVSGTSEAYFPFIDFDQIFGVKWGLRLRKGTNDRLTWTVRDDVTGVDQFDIIAYGIYL